MHLFRKARTLMRRFRRNSQGVAATEFALLVPAMMSIWVGLVVATDALTADKKVTLLTRTLADMTTQMQAVSQSDLNSIFQATESVMWPQPATRLGMRITSLDIDGANNVWIDWSSVPDNTTLRGNYSAMARCTKFDTLPTALKIARTSIVLAEVSMQYQASVATQLVDELFGGTITTGEMPLGDSLYMRARQSTKVQFNGLTTCPGYVN